MQHERGPRHSTIRKQMLQSGIFASLPSQTSSNLFKSNFSSPSSSNTDTSVLKDSFNNPFSFFENSYNAHFKSHKQLNKTKQLKLIDSPLTSIPSFPLFPSMIPSIPFSSNFLFSSQNSSIFNLSSLRLNPFISIFGLQPPIDLLNSPFEFSLAQSSPIHYQSKVSKF